MPAMATPLCQFYRYLLYDKFRIFYDKPPKHMETKPMAYLRELLPPCY